MQKALCNASAEQGQHIHVCSLDHGHKGKAHICKCGAIFVSVKKAELDKPLQKVQ